MGNWTKGLFFYIVRVTFSFLSLFFRWIVTFCFSKHQNETKSWIAMKQTFFGWLETLLGLHLLFIYSFRDSCRSWNWDTWKNNEIFSELFCFLSFYDTFSFHLHISIYWLRFIAANTHFFSYYFRARVFLRIFSFRPMQKFEQDHDDQYFNTARTNCCCVEIGDESFLC